MQKERHKMVENQLFLRGIKNQQVLSVMKEIPRENFVSEELKMFAYEDCPLDIGHDQTISQPYIVAFMTEYLDVRPEHTVLEVGTGCGYQTAILSRLANHIISLERIPELAVSAGNRLKIMGYTNVNVIRTNGWNGYEKKAPFQRILVTAAAKTMPEALINQLDNNGILIIPVGKTSLSQSLQIVRKNSLGHVSKEKSLPVRFVSLVNK